MQGIRQILDRIKFSDYPCLYLDGILIEGVAWAEQIRERMINQEIEEAKTETSSSWFIDNR